MDFSFIAKFCACALFYVHPLCITLVVIVGVSFFLFFYDKENSYALNEAITMFKIILGKVGSSILDVQLKFFKIKGFNHRISEILAIHGEKFFN